MKTIKLLLIMSIALCSSCQEQDLVYDSSIDSEDIIDVRMDSLLIYQKQNSSRCIGCNCSFIVPYIYYYVQHLHYSPCFIMNSRYYY